MTTYTIMAVDDQPEYLQSYAACFFEEKVPYKIISAVNGKMALDLARVELPDVIIMDWQMPVMNGLSTIKELKKDDKLKDIPVIMASGIMLKSEDLKEALEAGASDFIRKPVDKVELMARIHSHINLSKYIKSLKEKQQLIHNQQNNHILHIRETSLELCHKIEEMVRFTFKEHDDLINELKNLLSKNPDEEIILSQLLKVLSDICKVYDNYNSVTQLHFKEDKYVRRLLTKHPQLLPGEIELCLLVKRNLSSKDIAGMTFRSVNTIKVAKSKLRSKLNIGKDINIINYLIGI